MIGNAGYEGFCFGIDVVLQSLKMDTLPTEVRDVLKSIFEGTRHMPRRDALETVVQQNGYDFFVHCIARRALMNIYAGRG